MDAFHDPAPAGALRFLATDVCGFPFHVWLLFGQQRLLLQAFRFNCRLPIILDVLVFPREVLKNDHVYFPFFVAVMYTADDSLSVLVLGAIVSSGTNLFAGFSADMVASVSSLSVSTTNLPKQEHAVEDVPHIQFH